MVMFIINVLNVRGTFQNNTEVTSMRNWKITRKFTAFMSVIVLAISMFSTTAFAAEPSDKIVSDENDKVLVESGVLRVSYGAGDHDLGGFTFNDTNRGSARTFNTNQMQIKPAWKAADSSSSEVDLYIEVWNATRNERKFYHRFTLNDDVDGKDGAGWWYAESSWFDIDPGESYYIFYEAFTTPGYTPTGSNRSASVHTWIELRNKY